MAKDHLAWLRNGEDLSTAGQLACIIKLSIPAIFAQLTTVAMEYIDASMVGQLGKEAAASIGLVSSSTWLMAGITCSLATGFTVQVAHRIGAKKFEEARSLVKHGLLTVFIWGLIMGLFSVIISPFLPAWLGGGESIRSGATHYFMIYMGSLPILVLNYAAGGMLQSSGNMRTPSIINIIMCILDVVFNFITIFPTRIISIGKFSFTMPGLGLGVPGAALGTVLSELVCALLMLYFLLIKSDMLHLRKEKSPSRYRNELKYAIKLSIPIALEHGISGGAQVASTRIVAPLGNIAIAANSFSVTAEGLCYMPGYGISSAATALIGQSVGAGRDKVTKKLSFLTVALGMAVMAGTGVLMYIFAPQMLGILTPDADIQSLGATVLRIEAFAEPFYAASIVCAGVFRGMGKTAVPTIINLSTMWIIRIPLATFLSTRMGLQGVWTAMWIQLTICGIIFLVTLFLHFKRKDRKQTKELITDNTQV